MQLKSIFQRTLYEWMLAFSCIQFCSLFTDQLNFACSLGAPIVRF